MCELIGMLNFPRGGDIRSEVKSRYIIQITWALIEPHYNNRDSWYPIFDMGAGERDKHTNLFHHFSAV